MSEARPPSILHFPSIISIGLPLEPEDSQYGECRLKTHRQIKNPTLPPLRRVQVDRTPIRADGRTDAEINAARPKGRPSPHLIATAESLRAQEAERDRIRALSEPAGDAPADALAEPLEPLQQDQGAQVDDVPVADDAVDESDDAPAEAPPIEGREVDAPADALAEPLEPRPKPKEPRYRDTALRGLGSGVSDRGIELLKSGPGRWRSPTER